ncbi:uncharacterized protein [Panulirus ornatus]|uniref:uncharacterized protein n=1 Tax=Panulirus ornatus TaxID=150431 RepID=UPI003A8977DA
MAELGWVCVDVVRMRLANTEQRLKWWRLCGTISELSGRRGQPLPSRSFSGLVGSEHSETRPAIMFTFVVSVAKTNTRTRNPIHYRGGATKCLTPCFNTVTTGFATEVLNQFIFFLV